MDSPERLFAPVDFEPLFTPRRCERYSLDGTSTKLSTPSQRAVEAMVRNIAIGGFMVECPVALEIGSPVLLDIPGIGPVKAQVRWQIGPQVGGMFIDPISLAECEWTASNPPNDSPPA